MSRWTIGKNLLPNQRTDTLARKRDRCGRGKELERENLGWNDELLGSEGDRDTPLQKLHFERVTDDLLDVDCDAHSLRVIMVINLQVPNWQKGRRGFLKREKKLMRDILAVSYCRIYHGMTIRRDLVILIRPAEDAHLVLVSRGTGMASDGVI